MNAATVLTVYQEGNIIIELCVCIFFVHFLWALLLVLLSPSAHLLNKMS